VYWLPKKIYATDSFSPTQLEELFEHISWKLEDLTDPSLHWGGDSRACGFWPVVWGLAKKNRNSNMEKFRSDWILEASSFVPNGLQNLKICNLIIYWEELKKEYKGDLENWETMKSETAEGFPAALLRTGLHQGPSVVPEWPVLAGGVHGRTHHGTTGAPFPLRPHLRSII